MTDQYVPQALYDAYNAGELPAGSPGARMLEALLSNQAYGYPSEEEALAAARPPDWAGDLSNSSPDGTPRGDPSTYYPAISSTLYGAIPESLLSAERAGLLPEGSPGARMLADFRAQGASRPETGPEARPFPGAPDYRFALPTLPSILGAAGAIAGGVITTVGAAASGINELAAGIRGVVVDLLKATLPTVAALALGLASAAGDALDFLADNLAGPIEFAGALGSGLFTALEGLTAGMGGAVARFLAWLFNLLGGHNINVLALLPSAGNVQRTI